ncbi:MAG: DedA family protein [Thermodesulfobacteriota bacterium]
MAPVHYYLDHYGYLGIFLLQSLGIFGPPVADELLLLLLGYLVLKGNLAFIPTLAAVTAGTLIGVSLDYWLGRILGHYLLHRPDSWLHQKYRRIYQLRSWLARSGGWALTCSYFMPGWRHCAPLLAGLSRLDFCWFAALTFPGGLLWSLSYIFLGYYLGERWHQELWPAPTWILIIGGLLSLGLAYKFLRKKAGLT